MLNCGRGRMESYQLKLLLVISILVLLVVGFVYSQPSTKKNPTNKSFSQGELNEVNGIRVLKISGTSFDMAYQHGKLLSPEIKKGMIPYYISLLRKLFKKIPNENYRKKVTDYADSFLLSPMKELLSARARVELEALSWATGIPREAYQTAYVLPDAFLLVLGVLHDKGISLARSQFGCTSFAAMNDATKDGSLIIGRNLDYDGVGIWDQFPTLLFYNPTKGYKHVSATTAGVHTGGITAINEKGLSLSLHQILSEDVNLGTSILDIGDQIIRSAQSIEEAVKIIRENDVAGCWSYLMTDSIGGKSRIAVVSISSSKVRVQFFKDHIALSNFYLNREMHQNEYEILQSITDSSRFRFLRMMELLKNNYGEINVAHAADFLSDTFDKALGKEKSVSPNIISVVSNTQSVIFKVKDGKIQIWISNGKAPSSRGEYIGFDFDGTYLGTMSHTQKKRTEDLEAYVSAYRAHYELGDATQALVHLEQAIKTNEADTSYLFIKGMLLLELGEKEEARKVLEKVNQADLSAYQKTVYSRLKSLQAVSPDLRYFDILDDSLERLESIEK